MTQQKNLTLWQEKHKVLLEQALLNPDFYQELGFLRRDINSPLQTNEPESSYDNRLSALMSKYKVQTECFDVLKKFCTVGGELDYTLLPTRRLPNVRAYAKRDQEAYQCVYIKARLLRK